MERRRPLKRVVPPALLLLLVTAAPVRAQWTAGVLVQETAGIRRTAFPASVRLEVDEGRLQNPSQIALKDGMVDVAAQGTAWSTWPDGSVRDLEVNFNVSIGPLQERTIELRYGGDESGGVAPERGLIVEEQGESIQVGRVRLNRTGSPLLVSVAYREELIVDGRNGLAVTERSGIRHEPREIVWDPAEILKRGPLTVLLRYRGRLTLGGGSTAGVTIDVEMPNSKSWLKLATVVSDPDHKVRDIALETPLQLGAYPWTWEFATPNGTYGAFRDQTGSAILTAATGDAGEATWEVLAGSAADERPYEQSAADGAGAFRGWSHFVGPEEAVAFAIDGTGTPGTLAMWLTGTGQTSFRFTPAEPGDEHALTVYQHYVSTPVPIGAATSPASILNPLRVTVE